MVIKPSLEPAGLERAGAILTLSFDLLVVFTLMTGSPLDLSITTVRSIPLLPSGKNTPSMDTCGHPPSLTTGRPQADWGLWTRLPWTAAKLWSLGAPTRLSNAIKSAADMATLGVRWLVFPDWPLLIWDDLFESYGINEDQSAFCNMGANSCHLQASFTPTINPRSFKENPLGCVFRPHILGSSAQPRAPYRCCLRAHVPCQMDELPSFISQNEGFQTDFPSMTELAGTNHPNNY